MTRQEYMDRRDEMVAHREYYSQFVTENIKLQVEREIGLDNLLSSKDLYFSDIPLWKWDNLVSCLGPATSDTSKQLKVNGDWLSLGTGVCILKEAARQIVESDKI